MIKSNENNTFSEQLDLAPIILKKYIVDIIVVEGKAIDTAYDYFGNIMGFFRYIIVLKGIKIDYKGDLLNLSRNSHNTKEYNDIISAVAKVVDNGFIRSITKDDVKQYVLYMAGKNISPVSRNCKLSALRGFFEFCCSEAQIMDSSPCQSISNAKKEKKLPKYLTLDESKMLLENVKKDDNYARNFCIITLFLNCGLRLNELVNINISDIKDNALRIMGKGSKERVLHLNGACVSALDNWLKERLSDKYFIRDKNALFISSKASTRGSRISRRTVQAIVTDSLQRAGLGGKGYSTHKLRHTAATLMYQYGDVDVLTLKEVLGHEELNTTQIYTHINNKQVKDALEHNPLTKDYCIDTSENSKKGE